MTHSSCSDLVFSETQVFYEIQPLLSLACLTEALEGGFGRGPQPFPSRGQQPTPRGALWPGPGARCHHSPWSPVPALCHGLGVVRPLHLVCRVSLTLVSCPVRKRPSLTSTFATVRGNRQVWGLGADSSPSLPYPGSQGPVSPGPQWALEQPQPQLLAGATLFTAGPSRPSQPCPPACWLQAVLGDG